MGGPPFNIESSYLLAPEIFTEVSKRERVYCNDKRTVNSFNSFFFLHIKNINPYLSRRRCTNVEVEVEVGVKVIEQQTKLDNISKFYALLLLPVEQNRN